MRRAVLLGAVGATLFDTRSWALEATSGLASTSCANLLRHLQQYVHIPGQSLWKELLFKTPTEGSLCAEPPLRVLFVLLGRVATGVFSASLSAEEVLEMSTALDKRSEARKDSKASRARCAACPDAAVIAILRRLVDEVRQHALQKCFAERDVQTSNYHDELAFAPFALCMARPPEPGGPLADCCTMLDGKTDNGFAKIMRQAIFHNTPVPLEASMWRLRHVMGAANSEQGDSCTAEEAAAFLSIADNLQWRFGAIGADIENLAQQGVRCLLVALHKDPLGALRSAALPLHLLDRLCLAQEVLVKLRSPTRLTTWTSGRGTTGVENRTGVLAAHTGMRRLRMSILPYRDVVSDHIRATGTVHCPRRFQMLVIDAVAKHQAHGNPVRVVELGAFLGDCVLWAAASFTAVAAVAVEPFAEAARQLRRSAEPLGSRLQVITAAAGSQMGTWRVEKEADATQHYFTSSGHYAGAGAVQWSTCEQLISSESADVDATLPPLPHAYNISVIQKEECVNFITLDSLFESLGWSEEVDVVRMMVIGNEVAALEGARGALRRRTIKRISVECVHGQCDADLVRHLAVTSGYCFEDELHDSRWYILLQPC